MFRKGQRVRWYDRNARQVGPEQYNVAPSLAYALSHRWTDGFPPIAPIVLGTRQEGRAS